MRRTLITCITPTFNRANLLKKAIESTLSQTYSHWEMIIIDDGSTDNTEDVVKNYIKRDKRIRYFKNPKKGANAARNYGISQAKGEWIAFLDDDVENVPDRFAKLIRANNEVDINFIVAGYYFYTKKGNLKSYTKGWWATGAPMTSCWFIKKELIIKAGLFDETMPSMQETELSYRISRLEIYANLLVPLTIENNIPNSTSKGINGLKGKLILVEKHKDKMPKLELAWWYFTIAKDYYHLDEPEKCLYYLHKAAKLDKRKIYKVAYTYAKIFIKLGKPIKKINSKILQLFSDYKFPKLVEHPVIQ